MSNQPNRALVVEDDPSWQQILAEILRDSGLAVDMADNLPAAMDLVRGAPHRLAVLDLSLGGPDHRNQEGLQVMDAIKRQDPGCVSLLLTGFATVEVAVAAIQEKGAYTCLQKESFRRADFRRLVRDALAAVPPAAENPTEPPPSAAASPFKAATLLPDERALVIEDDAGWRSLLSELLAEAGYRVDECVSYV